MIIIDLIYNISVLVALSTLSGFINARFDKKNTIGKILQGFLFGIVTIIGMLYPFNLAKGIIFDGRSIVISLCTLLFGPVAGIISSLMGIIFRNLLGGGGALTGTLVIAASFLIGLLFHNLKLKGKIELSNKVLYLFGLLVSVVMMLIMITLPKAFIYEAVKAITLTVVIFYPLITLLIGKVLLDQEENKTYVNRINKERKLYKTTLYSIGDGVIVTDEKGVITQINQIAEKLIGWKEIELVGKPLSEIYYSVDEYTHLKLDDPISRISIARQRNDSLIDIILLFSKDGKEIPIEENVSPIINESGQRIGYVLVIRDLSEIRSHQKAIAESEEKLQSIFNTAPIGIGVIVDRIITEVNPRFCEMTGYTKEELLGNGTSILYATIEEYERIGNIKYGTSLNEKPGVAETQWKRKDGNVIDVLLATMPIKKDNINKGITFTALDITEKKKIEMELYQYRKHLEELVEERTKELDSLNKNLSEQLEREKELEDQLQISLSKEKEINELKTRFIATVSHEFRTPLASLLSSSQMIQRYSSRWTEEKLNEHYNRISSTVKYLTQLLDDVLTISRADREVLSNNPEKVNINELLSSLYQELESILKENHKLVFNYLSEKESIFIDKKLIRQIIINLLTNAIKYSPEGGNIELIIDYKNEYLIITVMDEGIGISEDEIKFIFDPFYRTKNSIGIQGSGLGLNIVLRSVEILGGNISVESKLNSGTKFLVRIPIYE